MTASTRPEGKSASDGKLDLVDAACREKLRRLSKEGGIAHNWKGAGVMALGAVVAAVFTIYLRVEIYNATDISTSMRGWGRLMYWITLTATPTFVLGAAWFAMQATRTAVSATFALACPQCKAIHELSNIHWKGFNVTCPACYSVIAGSADTHETPRRCEYCELEYFGAATGDCPGCRGGSSMGKCPYCKTAIPRGVICCVSCNQWLLEKETGFKDGTASYDPTRFGPKLARSYVIGIWERLAPVAEDLDALLKSVPNPGDFSPSTAGSVGGGLSTPTSILPKLALAAQWMQRPGVTAEPLPPAVAEGLAKLDAGVTRCADSGMKMHDVLTAIRTARRAVAG